MRPLALFSTDLDVMAVTASVPNRPVVRVPVVEFGAPDASAPMRLSVLGATGSIGKSTLDLVGRAPDRFEIVALTAQSNARELAVLARRHRARLAVIGDDAQLAELRDGLAGTGIRAAAGLEALIEAALMPADCVMAAIVGAAGLRPTFAAASCGARIALANKECLVSAGHVFTAEIARSGAELLPVDSEHSAAFQALSGADPKAIEKIVLTASGGPFRTWAREALEAATPEQAQEVHAFLRARLAAKGAAHVSVLYGGSVKPDNAEELFAQPDIDGGLIGGASLKAQDFLAICRAAR